MQKEITSGIDLVKTGELLKQKIMVEHLHRLSKILNVHMEELLATKGTEWIDSSTELLPFERRMLAYWKHMTAA